MKIKSSQISTEDWAIRKSRRIRVKYYVIIKSTPKINIKLLENTPKEDTVRQQSGLREKKEKLNRIKYNHGRETSDLYPPINKCILATRFLHYSLSHAYPPRKTDHLKYPSSNPRSVEKETSGEVYCHWYPERRHRSKRSPPRRSEEGHPLPTPIRTDPGSEVGSWNWSRNRSQTTDWRYEVTQISGVQVLETPNWRGLLMSGGLSWLLSCPSVDLGDPPHPWTHQIDKVSLNGSWRDKRRDNPFR